MSEPAPLPPLIDSHCHLTWPSFNDDRDEVIARMQSAGVEQAIVISTTVEDARAAREVAAHHPGLFPTAGIHPNDLPEGLDGSLAELTALIETGEFVAVGETGLDYYRDHTQAPEQRRSFEAQCRLARTHDLPVVVHIRDKDGSEAAYDEVAEIIEAEPGLRGVIHCYTGDAAHAERYLATGFSVSFSGIVTFPKGDNVRAAAQVVPLARMLVETDAPFLAPVPMRGKRNEPAFVVHTARALADLLSVDEAEFRRLTATNARQLFGLPVPTDPGTSPAPQ